MTVPTAIYFSVVPSSGRVLEALFKDEKLVPIVQAVQWFGRLTMTGSIFRSS